MFKKIIEDVKISRVSYLLETIKNKDISKKIKAFKKLDKMKISKEIGLLILDYATYDYGVNDGDGGINASLISLCMKDYQKEYSTKLKKIYPKLNSECQNKVVFLLSCIDNKYALELYVDFILKYYKDSKFIPISNLYERVDSYKLLFPKLFKALKFKDEKNNILILINDYLNAGVIPEVDLKKNKKILQDSVCKLLNLSFKYKFTNTSKAMQNEEYFSLRFFLEIAINIESYVSNKRTQDLIKKVFEKNDNQLKLFILENYIKKGKKINKLNLEPIAKDNASRYPLFDLLTMHNMVDLFPKKYLTGPKIAESDFYINFTIVNTYRELPKTIKFIKKKVINNKLYYIFKFKYTYKNNISYDQTTNYLIENAKIDTNAGKKITSEFIGISGGYNPKKIPSLVIEPVNKIMWSKIGKNDKIDDVVEKIIPDLNKKEKEKEIITEENLDENNKSLNEILNTKENEEEIKNRAQEDVIEQETFDEQVKKFKFKFGYILTLLLIVFAGTLIVFTYYLNDPEIVQSLKTNTVTLKNAKTAKLNVKDNFNEISGNEIFNQEGQYFVLLYKNNNKKENSYYYYINELTKKYKIYYVDLNKEDNKFLYSDNDLGFTVFSDRYVKVEDGDFVFYVDGKSKILEELQSEYKELLKEKKAEEKAKKEQEKKEKEQNNNIDK